MTTVAALKDPVPAAGGQGRLAALLAEALRREGKLLVDLLEVLRVQRAAVARDDLAAVDESVFAAQRIFRTLAEARKQRLGLYEAMGLPRETSLGDLDGLLGPWMREDLASARSRLQEIAGELARELAVNRMVLEGALAACDELVRLYRHGPEGAGTAAYDLRPNRPAPSGPAGTLLDRQA